MFKRTVPVLIGMVLLGCSTHPLVEDVTRQKTFDIVKSIRCEATLAVAKARDIPKPPLSPETLKKTYIGYDFQFLITENNNATASSLFTYPFATATFTAGLSAGAQRARASDRNFRIVESFHTLLADEKNCREVPQRGPNIKYPIAGSIGLEEVITTYVKINLLTHLATREADRGGDREERETPSRKFEFADPQRPGPDDLPEAVTVFSDKLTFTTKLVGGLKPSVKLSPVKGRFRLAEAAADLSADRTDVHKVTVAMAVEKSCKYLSKQQCQKNKEWCKWVPEQREQQRPAECVNNTDKPQAYGIYRRETPYTNYSPFAPAPAQALASGPGKVILELDRQRLLELADPLGFGLTP
jgi:hypothetical protein